MAEDCGCDEFAALADVEDEAPTDLHPDPRGTKVRTWSGLIAPYGVPTGDKRRFAANALSSRELPAPVKWQRTDNQGHSTSVVVGRIDKVHFGDDGVYASGIFFDPDPAVLPRLAEDANEAYELTKNKVIGPSVDLDDMEFHPVGESDEFAAGNERPEIEVTRGRISAITLVPIPAFAEARPFSLGDMDAEEYANNEAVITAAGVRGDLDMLPVAADAELDLFSWALDAPEDGALYASAAGNLFPVATVVDGQLSLIPDAVASAVSVLAYSADQVNLPEGVKDALRGRLESLTAACGLPNPPWAQDALVAAAGLTPVGPLPASAFEDPKFDGPTPPRIERMADGRYRFSGHVATWKTCHIGFQDRCVVAPKSKSNYSYFHVGEVQTDRGPLATGKITLGGGHADTRLGFRAAAEHYDDAGSCVADVRAGEDAYGIWVSGVVRPSLDETRLHELSAAPLSGDWRRVGGGMEMVAALAVNTPGFPIVRTDRRGDLALVAAGMVIDDDGDADDENVKAKGKKKKRIPAAADNDRDAYSLDEIADAVYARLHPETRVDEAVEVFAAVEADDAVVTLESSFAALDQIQLDQAAASFN